MTAYKLSRYTIDLPLTADEDKLSTVFNTITRSLVLMPAEQWEAIRRGSTGGVSDGVEMLSAQGILVAEDVDETALFHQWKDRLVHDFHSLTSKVMVSRQCNMRCTYCIIDKEPRTMTEETARSMDEFYLERIAAKKPRQVRDDYLGGEPLLNTSVIVSSATRRLFFCRGRGIDYGFTVTTNGCLVTRKVVLQLKAVGLTGLRVSLAGPAPVHDALRPATDGSATYEAILGNLEQVSGEIPISIEYQYDAGGDDYLRLPEMLDDLFKIGVEPADIAFTPILPKRNAHHFCAGTGEVDKFRFLQNCAVGHGVPSAQAPPSNACMAEIRSAVVFDTDGALIPCPALQSGEMAYGDVHGGVDFIAEAQLLDRRLPEKCIQHCELLPLCLGGCRLQALTATGDFSGIDCHYETSRHLLEDYIRNRAAASLGEPCQSLPQAGLDGGIG